MVFDHNDDGVDFDDDDDYNLIIISGSDDNVG